ncbi:hypothetical protein HN814_11505 [Candidatus Woesearchaeota archaeon]|nr:hypothetical protein [Candidatus Woesearchaeota archaeon]
MKPDETKYVVSLSEEYVELYKEGYAMRNNSVILVGAMRGHEDDLVIFELPTDLDAVTSVGYGSLIKYFGWRGKNLEEIMSNCKYEKTE